MATQNGATLQTIEVAWEARATAPALPVKLGTKASAALTLTANGDGTAKVFTVAHGLGGTVYPTVVVMKGQNAPSLLANTVTADKTNVTVTFVTAPVVGVGNVSFVGFAAY